MTKKKPPFQKIRGLKVDNYEYAYKHNRRPFVFSITTADGGTIETQGNVNIEDVPRLVEMLIETQTLANKQPTSEANRDRNA